MTEKTDLILKQIKELFDSTGVDATQTDQALLQIEQYAASCRKSLSFPTDGEPSPERDFMLANGAHAIVIMKNEEVEMVGNGTLAEMLGKLEIAKGIVLRRLTVNDGG